MDYIEVNKSELPEQFEIDLANETFILRFNYNATGDFFTVDLFEADEEETPLVYGEKLILNQPLWGDISSLKIPAPTIMPMDLGNKETIITFENFGESVFLYVLDGLEDDEL